MSWRQGMKAENVNSHTHTHTSLTAIPPLRGEMPFRFAFCLQRKNDFLLILLVSSASFRENIILSCAEYFPFLSSHEKRSLFHDGEMIILPSILPIQTKKDDEKNWMKTLVRESWFIGKSDCLNLTFHQFYFVLRLSSHSTSPILPLTTGTLPVTGTNGRFATWLKRFSFSFSICFWSSDVQTLLRAVCNFDWFLVSLFFFFSVSSKYLIEFLSCMPKHMRGWEKMVGI